MEIKWHLRSYTAEEFKEAWLTSNSIAETARKLGLTIYGNTYTVLRDTAKSLELTEKHFKGAAWRKGLTGGGKPHQPIEYYLVEGMKVSSSALKAKLIKAKLLKEECAAPFCPVPNPSIHPFTGESIPLKFALDHINGDNTDNRLENLRLLCYHCHGETDTWCGKDRKKNRPGISPDAPDGKKVHYCDCGKPRNARAKQCLDCYKATLVCECGNKKERSHLNVSHVPRKQRINIRLKSRCLLRRFWRLWLGMKRMSLWGVLRVFRVTRLRSSWCALRWFHRSQVIRNGNLFR